MRSVSTTLGAVFRDRLQADKIELAVQERDVEGRVVDHQLGAAHEFEELRRDLGKLRLVAQELGGEPVDVERAGLAVALGLR
jgi:hypothetical protein